VELKTTFAHSLNGQPLDKWEPLAKHLAAVGRRAAELAGHFGWAEVARIAGLLHDIGKCSAEFQAYIRSGGAGSGGDHSTAGARVAADLYGKQLGRMLAFVIAGHHAGLADGPDLIDRRLAPEYRIPAYRGWETHCGPLPPLRELAPSRALRRGQSKGFSEAFLIRMLFSALVDADSLETRRFLEEAEGQPPEEGGQASLASLRNRLRAYMAGKRAAADPTPINAVRAEVLDHAVARAGLAPGLFTMTVPTGGGKTLASLSFALEHAVRHGMRRVVYVIPFTSIIEQTAAVFREALGTDADILEHHASFDWERAAPGSRADDEGAEVVAKLRRAAENWDMPVVVTTAVQFFESLFSNKRSGCRKLHNLAGSVIVLDEAQTLPVKLLLPCLAAIDELARNYGASVVLCTATQPAIRKQDAAIFDSRKRVLGLDIDDDRELAHDPPRLYAALKRFTIDRMPGKITDYVIAARFAERPQMLCIVNSRKHARALFEAIRPMPGAVHLTTLMCPRHRRAVLAGLRERLAAGQPVRLVATSLIEAGVDIDFPEVWRAVAGLDSILQAGGRANREGRLPMGKVVVFEPAEHDPPRDLVAFRQAGDAVLRTHDDPQSLDAVRDYFSNLYWQKGTDALDAATCGGVLGILPALAERAGELSFPFATIAAAFRMIEEVMEPIVVPWRADDDDRETETLLARIAASERPCRVDLRRLQQYVVGLPSKLRDEWLAGGVLTPVHPGMGNAMLKLGGLALYDEATGVRLEGEFDLFV